MFSVCSLDFLIICNIGIVVLTAVKHQVDVFMELSIVAICFLLASNNNVCRKLGLFLSHGVSLLCKPKISCHFDCLASWKPPVVLHHLSLLFRNLGDNFCLCYSLLTFLPRSARSLFNGTGPGTTPLK